jgi:ABC-type transport system substrate-binding protein
VALSVTGVAVVGHFRTAAAEAIPSADYRAAVLTDHLPLSLNPLIDSEDPAVAAVTPLLYRSLLRLDATAYPTPDLASQLTISPSGLTYTLPLRPDLHWSDGSPITAQDALATIRWVQSAAFPDAAVASAWTGVTAGISGQALVLTLASVVRRHPDRAPDPPPRGHAVRRPRRPGRPFGVAAAHLGTV